MSITLNPYVSFTNTAREAMTFYQSVFGGDLTLSTFGDFHASEDPAIVDLIMHSVLTTGTGFTLMASDTAGEVDRSAGVETSISVSGGAEDAEFLQEAWDALSEGAEITMPLETAMWGDTFGMLTDRFGIHWMVSIGAAAS
ncbi:MAG: VOC family protein [Cryobacterium sp.]|nr:VOC family protein [Micrococcales bacterium]MBX3311213.1 VOC family protein [Cryobacterium sp.]